MTVGVVPEARVYDFNGTVDEIAIFGEELSRDDIEAIAERGLLGAPTVFSSAKLAISWGRIKTQ